MTGIAMRGLAVGLALLAAPGAAAQAARLTVLADSVLVGERFGVALAVDHAPGSVALFPAVPPGSAEAGALLPAGDAELLAARRLPPRLAGGVQTDSVVFEAATFALETARVGPLAVRVASGSDTLTLTAPAVALAVRSSLAPADTAFRPPRPPEPFPSPLVPLVVAALAALALGALAVWAWRRRTPAPAAPAPAATAYETALARLGALAPPPTGADARPYYDALATLLRTYLAARFGLPARTRTTAELTALLDGRVPEAARGAVRGVLDVADLVKFADRRPDTDTHEAARARAREALATLEATLDAPGTADGASSGTAHPDAPVS